MKTFLCVAGSLVLTGACAKVAFPVEQELPELSAHRPTNLREVAVGFGPSIQKPVQRDTPKLMPAVAAPVAKAHVTTVAIPSANPRAAHQLAPLSGGMLTNFNLHTYLASDPDHDAVWIVEAYGDAIEVQLQPGDLPGPSVRGPGQTVYVALRGGGALAKLDLNALGATQRISVCASPQGVAYLGPSLSDPSRSLIATACSDGQLILLDTATNAVMSHIQLDDDLRDIVAEDDHLFVSRFRSAQVLTVSLADGTFTRRTALSPDPNMTATVAWRLVPGPKAVGALLAHQLSASSSIDVLGLAASPTPPPDPSTACGTQSGYGPAPAGCDGVNGASLGCHVGVVATGLTLFQYPDNQTFVGTLNDVVPPLDLSVGAKVVVLGIGSQNLVTLDSNLFKSQLQNAEFGGCLSPLAASPLPEGTISVASATGSSAVAVLSRAHGTTQASFNADLGSSYTHELAEGPLGDDRGRELFYQATPSLMACASCHPDGREDGHVWNFNPMGARRTPSLGGGLLATAPFHWDGAEKNIGQLMTDVFVGRMSAPMPSQTDVDSLAAWLDQLPVTHAAVQQDEVVAERGKVLFQSAGCIACHSGEHFTNNASIDVGTGGVFQVPSLLGLGSRAPYLHNGCAPTLTDRFQPGCGGGDHHGNTSNLSAAQIGDLVAYLTTL
jgi:cytochrome c553